MKEEPGLLFHSPQGDLCNVVGFLNESLLLLLKKKSALLIQLMLSSHDVKLCGTVRQSNVEQFDQ